MALLAGRLTNSPTEAGFSEIRVCAGLTVLDAVRISQIFPQIVAAEIRGDRHLSLKIERSDYAGLEKAVATFNTPQTREDGEQGNGDGEQGNGDGNGNGGSSNGNDSGGDDSENTPSDSATTTKDVAPYPRRLWGYWPYYPYKSKNFNKKRKCVKKRSDGRCKKYKKI